MKIKQIFAGVGVLLLVPHLTFAYNASFLADAQELIVQLQERIKELQAQLEVLRAQEVEVANQLAVARGQLAFTNTLQRGMRGDEVTALQEFLKTLPGIYPEGLVTGYFGVLTEAAVKRWQTQYGIESVGIVGPKTRAKLSEVTLNRFFSATTTQGGANSTTTFSNLITTGTSTPLSTSTSTSTTSTATTTSSGTATSTSSSSGGGGGGGGGSSNTVVSNSSSSDTTAPVISGVTSASVTTEFAKITWNTNEAAVGKIYFSPGDQSFSTSSSLDLYSGYSTSHVFELSGLNSATTYYYEAVATDASGNTSTSSAYSFTTAVVVSTSTPDTTAPTISSVASGSVTDTTATITWTTNESATGQVYLSPDSATFSSSTSKVSSLSTSHSFSLSGLTASTLYYYEAVSADSSGNYATSSSYTFTTAATDTTGPVISNIQVSALGTVGLSISWTSDEWATGVIYFSPNDTSFSTSTNKDSNSGYVAGTSHLFEMTGLTGSTLYYYKVVATDAHGNTTTSSTGNFTTNSLGGTAVLDTTPPTISSVASGSVTDTTATITWTTNESATGQVYLSPDSATFSSSTSKVSSLSTSHSFSLSGLTASTLYYYEAVSADSSGNYATSSSYTFTTEATPVDSTAPVVSNVVGTAFGTDAYRITFTTDEAATGKIIFSAGDQSFSTSSSLDLHSGYGTSHTFELSGFASTTTYYYEAVGTDASGNIGYSDVYSFTSL